MRFLEHLSRKLATLKCVWEPMVIAPLQHPPSKLNSLLTGKKKISKGHISWCSKSPKFPLVTEKYIGAQGILSHFMGNLSPQISSWNFRKPAPKFWKHKNRKEKLSWGKGWKRKARGYVCIYSSTHSLQKITILSLTTTHPETHTLQDMLHRHCCQPRAQQIRQNHIIYCTKLELPPIHLKTLASFQGNSSPALAGLSQRGWSMTCGRNIELIRFNKPKFHTRLEGLSQQRPGGVTAGCPQAFWGSHLLWVQSSLFTQKSWKTNGLSQHTREVVESGTNAGETHATFCSKRSGGSSSECGHHGRWVISHLSALWGRGVGVP